MRYLVCYDITDDRRRQRVSELLLDFGSRVQESVFEYIIDAPLADQMQKRLRKSIDAESDSVFIFPICDACLARSSNLGLARQVSDPEFYIV
jgi:CRISPR-associated protein Cas2